MTETQQAEAVALIVDGTPALNAALAAVQRSLPHIDKGKTAEVPTKAGGKYTYTYADLADVSAAVLPLLGANGLAFTSWPTLSGNRFVLKYELLHESGQSKGGEYPLPIDAGAQALGSAITYARRYCLCAVTGIAPDDDDDAAAAVGQRQAERAEQQADSDRERQNALEAIKGAWFNQYGEWNATAAADMFETWSHGGQVATATPKQMRSFAAYLHAMPVADAGSDPTTAAATDDGVQVIEDHPLSGPQKGMMFALFEDLGMKNDRAAQLDYLSKVTGRTIKSRSDVLAADASAVLRQLEADVANLNQEA